MANLLEEFMKDSVDIEISTEALKEISKLAKDQLDWEQTVKQLESDLENAKEALRNIQEFLLPEAMFSAGMSEFKLTNGSKITVKEDVYASIKKDFIGKAVQWLDEQGLGGIVKDQINVDFGRGELYNAEELMEFCKSKGYQASEKLSVHPMTLKATVKEQLAQGIEFPDEFFSIAPIRKSIIKSK